MCAPCELQKWPFPTGRRSGAAAWLSGEYGGIGLVSMAWGACGATAYGTKPQMPPSSQGLWAGGVCMHGANPRAWETNTARLLSPSLRVTCMSGSPRASLCLQSLPGTPCPPALPTLCHSCNRGSPTLAHTSSQMFGHLEPKNAFPGAIRKFLFAPTCPQGVFRLNALSAPQQLLGCCQTPWGASLGESGKSKGYKVQRFLMAPTWVGGDGWWAGVHPRAGGGPAGLGSPLGSPKAPVVLGQWEWRAQAQWEHWEGSAPAWLNPPCPAAALRLPRKPRAGKDNGEESCPAEETSPSSFRSRWRKGTKLVVVGLLAKLDATETARPVPGKPRGQEEAQSHEPLASWASPPNVLHPTGVMAKG